MEHKTTLEKAHEQADHIFLELLPAQGLAVRPAQIKLCHEMIDAMFMGRIALCDAGVGIGKTHAYLVAGLIWQMHRPLGLPRTLTVSTSSVALQDAILQEHLPMLSRVLVEDGLLEKPIHAVIRKGRERYVCDDRLIMRQATVRASTKVNQRRKAALAELDHQIDMDKVAGLSGFDRTKVCVPAGCPNNCDLRYDCRYRDFLKAAKGPDVDVQICNHNYLLADAINRRQAGTLLLKDYHILIVDEAHKLPDAARQIYGESIALSELESLCSVLEKEHTAQTARRFRAAVQALAKNIQPDPDQEETEQTFTLSERRKDVLKNMIVRLRSAARPATGLSRGVAYRLERAADILTLFYKEDENRIFYIRYEETGEIALCTASRTTPAKIARDLWQTGRPAILASGTLAAGGSFVRIRQQLGLEKVSRCHEFVAASPFDYKNNSLLYVPDTAVDMDPASMAKKLRELLQAAHGHALVLFTSYTLMSEVCQKLKDTLPFPLLEAWRGDQQVIQQFKQLPNAVLCAAGPCWEGIDFPGDIVSLLVIVRLPFPTPDPVRDAEREQYPDLQDYISATVVPEMQTKLRQGVGRAIRTETDTCAVAILDHRAAVGGRYHTAVRKELPPCPYTNSIADVRRFIKARKRPEYFI